MTTKKRYDTDLRSLPGMTYRVDIADPKDRVQAYMDSFRDGRPDVSTLRFYTIHCPLSSVPSSLAYF